jgi:hypothetical protein
VTVRRGSALSRDLASLVRDLTAGRGAPDVGFPCSDCEFRASCYPADTDGTDPIPAERLLTAVNYFDSPVVPLELCRVQIDELFDLLGGADGGVPGGGSRWVGDSMVESLSSGPTQSAATPTEAAGWQPA